MCGLVVLPMAIERDQFEKSLKSLKHRGPDATSCKTADNYFFGFNRLAINDLSSNGNQPFISKEKCYLVCNGEIYNSRELKKSLSYDYISESDCEVILPLIKERGFHNAVDSLDGEFAFVYYDSSSKSVWAARDSMGIRPLFYGKTKDGEICFASEVKALIDCCDEIHPFPPGHFYQEGEFHCFHDYSKTTTYRIEGIDSTCERIEKLLTRAVHKRLDADAPIGFLLSGGLDSSLVCSIAAKKLKHPIKTFSVGMRKDAIDLKYAREVADFIGSEHHEVIMTDEDVINSLPEVIRSLESWDITTIRASIGMYHVCRYIREKTQVKALLTGEVADEIFGYKYTDFAPDEWAFQKEAQRRVKELYFYDVLRADRCISAHSLEARVPFSDREFVDYVMSVHPKLKMNFSGHGKFLLRKAFEGKGYLPDNILWREKAAFSDAVGHSMVDTLKEYASLSISDHDFELSQNLFSHARPFTKESLLYRKIFEIFYTGKSELIPDYWMPNKEWKHCNVEDPSARVLPNYGASGF